MTCEYQPRHTQHADTGTLIMMVSHRAASPPPPSLLPPPLPPPSPRAPQTVPIVISVGEIECLLQHLAHSQTRKELCCRADNFTDDETDDDFSDYEDDKDKNEDENDDDFCIHLSSLVSQQLIWQQFSNWFPRELVSSR
jgi:hypothetical protein